MTRRQRETLIKGAAAHRRTESGYMGVLLDAVTFDDWRDVVNAALLAAKQGDQSARAWLGQYLLGRPEMKAPTPPNIVVQQLNGDDPVVDRLARPVINRELFPMAHETDEWEESVKALVAAELAERVGDAGEAAAATGPDVVD